MGKVVTTSITQEYCVPTDATVIFNKPIPGDPLVYRQMVSVRYNILAPDFSLIRVIEESFTLQETAAPLQLADIETGFKGAWTDTLISQSQAVISRETTSAG